MIFMAAAFWTINQEDLDARLDAMIEKISPDKIKELAQSDPGRRAMRELVLASISWQLARYDKDPMAVYEEHLFERSDIGILNLRPERKADPEELRQQFGRSSIFLREFDKRANELLGQIKGQSAIDHKMKSMWSDPQFHAAAFYKFAREVPEFGAESAFEDMIGKVIQTGPDDKLVVNPASRDDASATVDWILQPIEIGLEHHEKFYREWTSTLKDEAERKLATSDGSVLLITARMLRYGQDGAERPLEKLLEDNKEKGLVHLILQSEKLMKEMKDRWDRIAQTFSDAGELDRRVKQLFQDPRHRILLLERLQSILGEAVEKADTFFEQIRTDMLSPKDGGSVVKQDRFKDAKGNETPEAVEAALHEWAAEYADRRAIFDDLAERCTEKSFAEIFRSKLTTYVIQRHVEKVVESQKSVAQSKGVQVFTARYLVPKGDRLEFPPNREYKLNEFIRRAAEIKQELERQK